MTTTTADLSVESRAYLALEEVRLAGVLEETCLQASISANIAWTMLYVDDDVEPDTRVEIPSDPRAALASIQGMLSDGIEQETDLRTQLRLDRALELINEAITLLTAAVTP